MHASQVHSSVYPQQWAALNAALVSELKNSCEGYKDLQNFGIGMDSKYLKDAMSAYGFAMDSLTAGLTTGTIPTPIQFLQEWLPGIVQILTRARKIDEIIPLMTAGTWADEEVVQMVMEKTGSAVLYGDTTNVPFANWNPDYERRTIVRGESGMEVGILEEERASAIRISSADAKRGAAAIALDIFRNSVGFNGYASGANRTYGYLNDPGLPNYVTVANGAASSPLWSTKTAVEIYFDVVSAAGSLQSGSGDLIDPHTTETTLAVATDRIIYLDTAFVYGNQTARGMIAQTFPKMRIVSAPELSGANGGASVFYLQADKVNDGMSTDGGAVFAQIVPQKFRVLGIEKKVKGYMEGYSNATAGVMCKRPFGVVRRSGI